MGGVDQSLSYWSDPPKYLAISETSASVLVMDVLAIQRPSFVDTSLFLFEAGQTFPDVSVDAERAWGSLTICETSSYFKPPSIFRSLIL